MAEKKEVTETVDYSLNNPDTLTKYKSAAVISKTVLDAVTKLCVADAKIVEICEKGDALLEEEISKVYRGNKKLAKGMVAPKPHSTTLTLCKVSRTQRPFPHPHSSPHTLLLPPMRPKLQSY